MFYDIVSRIFTNIKNFTFVLCFVTGFLTFMFEVHDS